MEDDEAKRAVDDAAAKKLALVSGAAAAPPADESAGHVGGNNSLPFIVNGWAQWPSVINRYYTTHTTSNHQCLHVHSNGVCVLSIAPTHPMLQPPLRVTEIAYRTHDAKNLMQTSVRGKKKAGAVFVTPRDMVCTVTLSDGSSVTLFACVRANVIEINHRLIDRPELLGTPEGYAHARRAGSHIHKHTRMRVEHTRMRVEHTRIRVEAAAQLAALSSSPVSLLSSALCRCRPSRSQLRRCAAAQA
jgi:hypothetical protein